jgi:mannose-6-phosphate isomerase-like protein (cupin superfamily)
MALKPLVFNMKPSDAGFTRILGGPPNSVFMRSGKVVLQPGEVVGEHSTESNEELIIILEGQGSFLYDDNKKLAFDSNCVLYCPPLTLHNIQNTGSTPLRYIYVVAKAT